MVANCPINATAQILKVVTVRLNQAGRIINGHGADTDIVVASVKAYLDALNLINAKSDRAHPQEETI